MPARIRELIVGTVTVLLGCRGDLLSVGDPGNLVPRTVAEDPSLPAIDVNGTRLHAETAGTPGRPMVVVVHGGPGADYRYLLRCRELADSGFFVVFYDQRGTGLSRREPRGGYSVAVMVADLAAVIGHYRVGPEQPVFLLGHSWGGILATAFIERSPDAATGVILAEPGGFTWPDIEDYVARARRFSPLSETLNDAAWLDRILSAGREDHAAADYQLGLLAYTDGATDSPLGDDGAVPFWRAGAVTNQALFDIGRRDRPDWTAGAAGYSPPVLFLYSERNRAYGAGHAERVASAYPNVTIELVRDAGHDLFTFAAGWRNAMPLVVAYLRSRAR
ncbi:MAG: alpha/beta fold hydrolase [Gemmatimonadales bacterium]